MTFEQFMQKALDVFPDALVHEDTDGNIVIEPGFYEVPGQTELGTYKPRTEEDTEPEDNVGCSCGEADYGAPGHDGGPEGE